MAFPTFSTILQIRSLSYWNLVLLRGIWFLGICRSMHCFFSHAHGNWRKGKQEEFSTSQCLLTYKALLFLPNVNEVHILTVVPLHSTTFHQSASCILFPLSLIISLPLEYNLLLTLKPCHPPAMLKIHATISVMGLWPQPHCSSTPL